jgi:enoyl-CoA hydratase
MPWRLERQHDDAVIVTMNTNGVNAQYHVFFTDLRATLDRPRAKFNDSAVALTSGGAAFSAGLDFDYHFPLFA